MSRDSTINLLLTFARAWCVAAAATFVLAFATTYVAPERVEKAGHDFLVSEVTKQVEQKLGVSRVADIKTKSAAMEGLLRAKSERVRQLLDSKIPEIVSQAIAEHCGCSENTEERANSLASMFRHGAKSRLKELEEGISSVRVLALGFYAERLRALTNEVRVFSGTNAFLYVISALLLFLRGARKRLVLVPVILLSVATSISVAIYATGQSWFRTILTSDYFGWSYLGLVGTVLMFVCDILLNKGRVTIALIDAVTATFSSAC